MKALRRAADFAAGASHRIGRLFERYGAYAFLDARQASLGAVFPLDFEAAIRAYLSAGGEFSFIQIGAHEGDEGDPLSESIRAHGLRGVMVEPQPAPFAVLQANFADQPQLRFERVAIAPNDGSATFYSVDREFWDRHGFPKGIDTQIASLNPAQIRFHVRLFGGAALAEREDEYLRCEEIPAMTLATLQAKHGIPRPSLLQIDTEGFDFEVIKMIDWANPPDMVHYETVHLGVPDRMASWALLRSKGYRLYATNSFNTLAIRDLDKGG